jgi:hypothetical protein
VFGDGDVLDVSLLFMLTAWSIFFSVKADVMNFVKSDLGSSTASLPWDIDGALTTIGYPAETFNERLVT